MSENTESYDSFEARLLSTIDCAEWAKEFNAVAVRNGYASMDEGWLMGWFAGAMAARMDYDGRKRFTESPPAKAKANIPGFWSSEVSAYSDSVQRCPVLSCTPNGGDANRKGYLNYLIFRDNEAYLQVGPVLPVELQKAVMTYQVPHEVTEASIQAAMSVVLAWYKGRVGG